MALFKISKGASTTLPALASSKDGYCYFTTDDGMFYIDWAKADKTLVRSPLNANNAKTLMGKSVTDNITNTAAYIPHAKAVFDALQTRDNNIEDLENDKMDKVGPTGSGSFSMNGGRATGTNSIAFADSKNPPDDTVASGYNAFAMGLGSVASSTLSFARGEYASASGEYSVADGLTTEATAMAAHARGCLTKATANYAFAEGHSTTASEQSAHAEGEATIASGKYSHAEGSESLAAGNSSHAEGSSVANGSYSHSEGCDSTAEGRYSHAEGYGTKAEGEASHVEGNQNTITATGTYGHAEGNGTTVSGASGHAEGDGTIAKGSYSHAEGSSSIASGESAHAEGEDTEAIGKSSHSQGSYTTAFGAHSFAGGNGTVAYGVHSFAHGHIVAAVGTGAHAEGYGTTRNIIISGSANSKTYTLSAVEAGIQPGCLIYYNGKCAAVTAYDNNLTVTLDKTLSEKTLTKVQVILYHGGFAYGQYSHSEGIRTKVFGEGSHAEGNLSEARGNYSHAEGNNTKAEGAASHAQNLYTIANGEAQTVIGKYNVADTTSAFIIGKGTSDSARANAFAIDWNGKAYFANLSTAKTNQILKAGGGNLELSTETLGSDDNPVYLKGGVLTLTASKFSDFLSLQGGNMTGHIYMTGSKPASSTSNTSQLVFGTATTQHVAISSNDNTLVINPNTS